MESMFCRPPRKLLPMVLFLFSLGSVSCGKSNSRTYTKIDDMEGSGGRIEWQPPSGGQPGFWSSSTSCAQVSRILPEPFSATAWTYETVPMYETMPGVTSTHAAELRTKPGEPLVGVWSADPLAAVDWGANMGFDFAHRTDGDAGASQSPSWDADAELSGVDAGGSGTDVDPAPDGAACVQAAPDPDGVTARLDRYCGITFWAKAAADGRQAIRVQFNDVNTDLRGGQCSPSDPKTKCYNGFGKALMLTDTFTQYQVDFSELRQEPSWGNHPSGFNTASVYGMNFQVDLPSCLSDSTANCVGNPAPVAFDIWIDDLYFVNCEP